MVTTFRMPDAPAVHPGPDNDQESTPLGFEFAAGVRVAIRAAVTPDCNVLGPVNRRLKLLVMESAALACFVLSATLVAVIVTSEGFGKMDGAV